MIVHPIPPFYDDNSNILILGSFPSVKSRETQFFYGHPQNKFWRVVGDLFGEKMPESIPEKREFLQRNRIALWDVIHSCDIDGSADSTIKNVTPNDLRVILDAAPVKRIFVNGRTSEKYYKKYIEKDIDIKAVYLPSTSPANAAWTLEKLETAWKIILD
ncbi:MAG: DNA-deoxyinosine glycosylase [Lachnospiraceae bacterium]|nr:DNA-deoxyinosine glycosylase [Lachnospiraceae bacterium]